MLFPRKFRQRFMVGGVVLATGAGLAGWLQQPTQTEEFHEAIIIGSGYGGAVSALRLGQAGISTVVFEKGRDWEVEDPQKAAGTFANLESLLGSPVPDPRTVWLSELCFGNAYLNDFPEIPCVPDTGILEGMISEANPRDLSPKLRTSGIQVMTGVGVGGGSLVNNGITYRPLREGWELAYDLRAMPWMDGVWQDLDATYFARAESVLQPSPIPADILASPWYANAQIHHGTMIAAGYPETDNKDENRLHGTSLLPMIVDWDAVREEMAGKRTPSVIAGEAWWGINSGAKKSLNKPDSYLGQARATGHVDIRPLHTVRSISFDGEAGLYTLEVSRTSRSYEVLEEITARTPRLIVSAGSVGTTKLLLAARHQGGLPRLNEHLGTKWSTNGNISTFRVVSTEVISQGGPAGSKSTDFDDPQAPVVIENLSQKVPVPVLQNPESAALGGAVFTIGIGIPSGEGSFSWDDETESAVLHWPDDGAKNIYDRFFGIMAGLDPLGPHVPLTPEESQGTTLHPLGGVPLGLATDLHCQLKNYPGLYAVDGSIIPGSSALANPSLLIASLAERCMERIVGDILASRVGN